MRLPWRTLFGEKPNPGDILTTFMLLPLIMQLPPAWLLLLYFTPILRLFSLVLLLVAVVGPAMVVAATAAGVVVADLLAGILAMDVVVTGLMFFLHS